MTSKKKVKYKSRFQNAWLEDEELKVWFQKDKTQAYCRLCMKASSIATEVKVRFLCMLQKKNT